MDAFEPSEKARIFLQGGGNYRDRVATIQPYKGNRDPSKRPTWYHEIREYLQEFCNAELVTGMETDDACGIEQWKHKDRSTCIVSIDKDLLMIPGTHYNFVKQEFVYVTLAEANKRFWLQVLTGDTTDNIRGIPKVGIKTAEKILAGITDWTDMHLAVKKAYADRGIEHEMHENATLLWIMREHMINYNGEQINVNDGSIGTNSEPSVGTESQEESGSFLN